jgi:hypothetical protein
MCDSRKFVSKHVYPVLGLDRPGFDADFIVETPPVETAGWSA